MNEKEKKIKEQRTIEATQKNLMGISGKIGVVVRTLGQTILNHREGGAYHSSSYMEDWNSNVNNIDELHGNPEEIQSQIPYMDMPNNEEPLDGAWRDRRDYILNPINVTELGWYFDGLSRGIHLEIKYSGDEYDRKHLTLTYKGYKVYEEIGGDLEMYVPMEEWEQIIEKLYLVGKKIEAKNRKSDKVESVIETKRSKTQWLQKMRNKWGI